MEPQNQVRLETLFPDFCFQVFGTYILYMVWGARYPTPQYEYTAQQWSQSSYKLFFFVEVLFLLAYVSLYMLR